MRNAVSLLQNVRMETPRHWISARMDSAGIHPTLHGAIRMPIAMMACCVRRIPVVQTTPVPTRIFRIAASPTSIAMMGMYARRISATRRPTSVKVRWTQNVVSMRVTATMAMRAQPTCVTRMPADTSKQKRAATPTRNAMTATAVPLMPASRIPVCTPLLRDVHAPRMRIVSTAITVRKTVV